MLPSLPDSHTPAACAPRDAVFSTAQMEMRSRTERAGHNTPAGALLVPTRQLHTPRSTSLPSPPLRSASLLVPPRVQETQEQRPVKMEIEVRSCRGLLLRPFVIIAAIITTVCRTAITSAKISSSSGRKMSLQVIER